MLLGSDGPGGIDFDDAELAREVGIVGLVLILFEGGLQTSWRRLRSVAVPAALLSTVGVVVTALLAGFAARLLFDLSWLEAVLLGAVVASTDAAAVFATLRFTHIRRRLARTLEADRAATTRWRSRSRWADCVDREARTATGFDELALLVVRQIGLGLSSESASACCDLGVRSSADSIGAFAPVASLAAAALSFGVADVIGGSGFLAVYLVGLAIGSTPSRYRRQLVAFHEGLAFLAQVALFIVLGLLVFPSQLADVAARASRWRCSSWWSSGRLRSGYPPHSMTSPRANGCCSDGPGSEGPSRSCLPRSCSPRRSHSANTIFNAVFFVVVVSAILQGTTLEWVAGRLDLLSPAPPRARASARGRRAEQARPDRLRGRARPRNRRCRRPRGRPPAHGNHRRRRPRRRARSRPVGARSSSLATASSSSHRAPRAMPSRTSSLAGAAECSPVTGVGGQGTVPITWTDERAGPRRLLQRTDRECESEANRRDEAREWRRPVSNARFRVVEASRLCKGCTPSSARLTAPVPYCGRRIRAWPPRGEMVRSARPRYRP